MLACFSGQKKFDLLVLIFLPIIIFFLLFIFRAGFLISTLFLFGVPSIFILSRNKKLFKKSFWFSIICSIPATFLFDYLVVRDNGWYIINSVFSFRIFGVVVLEQFIWGFLWLFYSILFYRHFIDVERTNFLFFNLSDKTKKRMKYFSIFVFSIFLLFVLFLLITGGNFRLSYAYLLLGVFLIAIPLFAVMLIYPHLIKKFALAALYFIPFSMLVEYMGLSLGHWIFPGANFVGRFMFFGFRIPYEEMIIYFIFFTPSALAYYEFFDDDRK